MDSMVQQSFSYLITHNLNVFISINFSFTIEIFQIHSGLVWIVKSYEYARPDQTKIRAEAI